MMMHERETRATRQREETDGGRQKMPLADAGDASPLTEEAGRAARGTTTRYGAP